MSSIHITREAIFYPNLDQFGYRLIVHEKPDSELSYQQLESELILDAFTEQQLEKLSHEQLLLLPIPDCFIEAPDTIPFPPEPIVFEISQKNDPKHLKPENIKKLADNGYILSIDATLINKGYKSLIKYCDIVSFNLKRMKKEQIPDLCNKLQPHGIRLLINHVDEQEDLVLVQATSVDLLCGQFLAKPRVIRGQKLEQNTIALLQLITKLQDPDAEIEEIEELTQQDVALSVKILRYINSAAIGLRKKVESIAEAVIFLGRDRIKSMVTLLALNHHSKKPRALIHNALVRAYCCQMLAAEVGLPNLPTFFTVGLLSNLDALLDQPLEEIVKTLALSDEITDALLYFKGDYGLALRCVSNLDWDMVDQLEFFDLDWQQITKIHNQAMQKADEAFAEI